MKPYYEDKWVRIFHGDCRDILPSLEPVDLVLTDPPYGMNLDTDFSGMESKLFTGKTGGNYHKPVTGDNERFDPSDLMRILSNVKEQLWFGADYYCQRIPDLDNGSWLVWDKRLDDSADKMWGSTFEMIWSKTRHRKVISRYKWAGIFGMEHQDISNRVHPTQKPIELMLRLVLDFSIQGNLILDPFLGSGTTCYCAKKLQRRCIGIEIEEKYCEIAAKRCMQEVMDFELPIQSTEKQVELSI